MGGRNRGMDDFFQGGHSPLFQFSLFPVCNYFSHQCLSFSEKQPLRFGLSQAHPPRCTLESWLASRVRGMVT